MTASTDPFGVDLSALETVSAGSPTVPSAFDPNPAVPPAPVADAPEQSAPPSGSPTDQLRTGRLHSAEPTSVSEPAAVQDNSVPVPSSDSPNAQDLIHTTYGTVDAPREGELSSSTVTPDGILQTANDLNGDGVVESVEVELTDGSRVVYGDTDLDGSFDTVRYETTDFRTYQVESDTDGDGRIDTVITFDEDYTATVSTDTDGDGLADENYTSADGLTDPI